MSDADDMSFDITTGLDEVQLDTKSPTTPGAIDELRRPHASSHENDEHHDEHHDEEEEQRPSAATPAPQAFTQFDDDGHHEPESPPVDGDLSRPSWSVDSIKDNDGDERAAAAPLAPAAAAAQLAQHSSPQLHSIPLDHDIAFDYEETTFDSIQLNQEQSPSTPVDLGQALPDTSPPPPPLESQRQLGPTPSAPRPSTPPISISAEQVGDRLESPQSPTLSLSAASSTPATTTAATSRIDLEADSSEQNEQASAADDSSGPPPLSPTKSKTSFTGEPIAVTENGEPATTHDVDPSSSSSSSPSKAASGATKQKRLGTKVPSVMQKVMSMTRQRDLPPKDREEEVKHLKELEAMRAAAKESERRRQSQVQAAAMARASRVAAAHSTWEHSVLPNWRIVTHDNPEGRELRQLWWDGTMPVRWRGRLWGLCIGNGLAVIKNSFAGHLERAKKGLQDGSFPEETMKELEEDVQGTLPTLKLFQKGGVMHDDLVDLLLGYVVYVSSQTGSKPRYPAGLACSASMLLVNMPAMDAFVSLINLVHKSFLKSFYGSDPNEPDAYYRIFDTLLADYMPKVYENFSKEVVRPSLYLYPWLRTMFVQFVPLDLSTRLFDVFLLEGDSFVFRVALVLLQILEPRLFNPVQAELDDVFKGRDRGAVAVVRRERSGSVFLGGGGETEQEVSEVLVEEVYTKMGCTEEKIFDLLKKQEWKEETWERLVERELPEAD